jgi:DNA topoisomerase-2
LQIEKLLQQAADKEKELLALLELTPIQIWNTDLDRFLEEWEVSVQRSVAAFSLSVYMHDIYLMRQKACQEWEDKAVVDSSGKKVKRKQATLKTRKSIGSGAKRLGGGDDDGDDDFMPTKKAAAAKARKPIAPAAGSSRAKPKPKGSDDDIDFDEDEETLVPRPTTTKKRALPAASAPKPKPPLAPVPAPRKVESGSDIEMIDEGRQPPKPSKSSSAAKDEEEEDEDDSGDDLIRRALEKGKGKATQTGKRKS